jgi:hypothetical protein
VGLSELYNPGFTYLNADLANHYALDSSNLSTSFNKVATTANQGGLLHMGIFHTSNSGTDSTHLIRRSRVVRENLLCRNLGTPVGMIPESINVPELSSEGVVPLFCRNRSASVGVDKTKGIPTRRPVI